jgi:hypothetical protein
MFFSCNAGSSQTVELLLDRLLSGKTGFSQVFFQTGKVACRLVLGRIDSSRQDRSLLGMFEPSRGHVLLV